MEIHAITDQYDAQKLQELLNPNPQQPLCIVLGGEHPHEYIVIVGNDFTASIIKGALNHYNIEYKQ